MAAQNGRDLLIRIDMTGDGLFETVAGLRAQRLSLNAQSVEVTHLGSQGWREILGGAGVKSAAIAGSGVFRDEGTDARMRQVFFDGETPRMQVVIPGFGTMEGTFQVTAIDYAGTHDGEAAFEIAMASAGPLAFTPEAV
ncbi:phage major tail protein, TP901-1 family [Limimaricola pyoseonensis]|uniref:Phage major tail protein, TP901-1 family n=1 Tax=Limimaricola pyoseonensis TaxID=521013 RepID=A0A1G7AWU5_9RHOB|nr:phage major tail protein, TP901-1 family [Limimaricola pyoseonensis]SDE19273.1 phage major tail protein, TP901-1 family [Limimaricola pyoseonensis]